MANKLPVGYTLLISQIGCRSRRRQCRSRLCMYILHGNTRILTQSPDRRSMRSSMGWGGATTFILPSLLSLWPAFPPSTIKARRLSDVIDQHYPRQALRQARSEIDAFRLRTKTGAIDVLNLHRCGRRRPSWSVSVYARLRCLCC